MNKSRPYQAKISAVQTSSPPVHGFLSLRYPVEEAWLHAWLAGWSPVGVLFWDISGAGLLLAGPSQHVVFPGAARSVTVTPDKTRCRIRTSGSQMQSSFLSNVIHL